MNHKANRAGFTLIELMIVVAIIAIIASVAIPRLMSARLAANESAAIATLRSLSSAQAQVQSSGAIDTDADGGGEYAYLAELAGTAPVRITAGPGAGPAPGVVNVDELNPAMLSAAFGNLIVGQPLVSRSGYVFQVFLPGPTPVGGGAIVGVAEDGGAAPPAVSGGKAAAPFPNANNSEVMWAAYAWPIQGSQSGNRTFFINQDGDVCQTLNRGPGSYTGLIVGATTPTFGAAYDSTTLANDMAQPIAVGPGVAANDGNVWTLVQ